MAQDDQVIRRAMIIHQLEDLPKLMKGAEFSIKEVEIVDEQALKTFLAGRRQASMLWKPIQDAEVPPPKRKRE